jgi:hypothetical protein
MLITAEHRIEHALRGGEHWVRELIECLELKLVCGTADRHYRDSTECFFLAHFGLVCGLLRLRSLDLLVSSIDMYKNDVRTMYSQSKQNILFLLHERHVHILPSYRHCLCTYL